MAGKPRLLIVCLENSDTKAEILKLAPQLRYLTKWKRVFVTPDLTKKEREEGKRLPEELHARKQAGEENLTIRKGRIVQLHGPSTTRQHDDNVRPTAGSSGKAPMVIAPTGIAPAAPSSIASSVVTSVGMVPSGIVTSGTAPTGSIPHGEAPSGSTPIGTAPNSIALSAPIGVAPVGIASSGVAPSDAAPAGAAPHGIAPAGTAPSSTTPSGEAPAAIAPSSVAPSGPVPRTVLSSQQELANRTVTIQSASQASQAASSQTAQN